jgi:hypothetical protein
MVGRATVADISVDQIEFEIRDPIIDRMAASERHNNQAIGVINGDKTSDIRIEIASIY